MLYRLDVRTYEGDKEAFVLAEFAPNSRWRRIIEVRRSQRLGDYRTEVEINWSAIGSVSVEDGIPCFECFQEALAFAQLLRQRVLSDTTLQQMAQDLQADQQLNPAQYGFSTEAQSNG